MKALEVETEIIVEEKNFRIFERDKYYIIHLLGELPEVVPLEMVKEMGKMVLRPGNVVVNCFGVEKIPPAWSHLFQCLSYILLCLNRKVGGVYMEEITKTPALKAHEGLLEFFKDILPEGQPFQFHFLKAFIFSTLRTLMVQAYTPSTRKDLYLRQQNMQNFLGTVNGVINVFSETFFYVVSLSFPEKTFLKVISLMLGENITQMGENIKDGAAELIQIILGQTKKIVNVGQEKIIQIDPKTVLGKSLPEETITFKGKEWTPFRDGPSVVIHFTSPYGDYFVEIWFPSEFKGMILETLKVP